MGVSKLKSREVKAAIKDFQRANSGNDPAVYDGLGCCYHMQKQYEEAMINFNEAINARPQKIDFLRNRARCYFDMGEF